MRNKIWTCFCSILLLIGMNSFVRAQEAEVKPFQGTTEEMELIGIIERMNEQRVSFYADLEKITDQEENLQYYLENEPGLKTAPLLFEFEAKHRGTIVGLMALRQLSVMGVGGGPVNNPLDLVRRKALKYLEFYAEFDELNEIVRYLTSGNYESETENRKRTSLGDPRQECHAALSAICRTDTCQMVFRRRRVESHLD